MATSISEIVSNAMVYIDDVRLKEELALSPALFYRKMWLYVKNALPLLNRPPQLLGYLQKNAVEPMYDSFEWESGNDASLSNETKIETGKIGYEICSVVMRSGDGTEATPYLEAVYDAETGVVTIPQQDEPGIVFEMDFYKDGQFNDMTVTMKRLFGLAIAVVWDEHFERNWLNLQPKIKDSSFSTVNEANFAEKSNERLMKNRQSYNDELRKYEQDCAYAKVVGGRRSAYPKFV